MIDTGSDQGIPGHINSLGHEPHHYVTVYAQVDDLDACPAGSTILHVSLRDLSARVILSNHNIVDDLEHVNRAATSIHLASERTGNTDFVHGSLGDILLGKSNLPERDERKIIFSPFGLGVLDLAVADLVQNKVVKDGGGTLVESFLP